MQHKQIQGTKLDKSMETKQGVRYSRTLLERFPSSEAEMDQQDQDRDLTSLSLAKRLREEKGLRP